MNRLAGQASLSIDPDFVSHVRDVLANTDFTEKGVLTRLNCDETISVAQKEMPRLLRMTNEGTPLDTLIRLFIFGVDVDGNAAIKALKPMTLDSWCEGGLLKIQGDAVVALLRVVPHTGFLIAFDHPVHQMDYKAETNQVPGPGLASTNLLNATIRRKVGRVLDLGTGCGIQGMACSRHSERVTSTDINPRALNFSAFNMALNRLENIEIRNGSLFDPVHGETFELITMNPPFAISPETRFSFRDGGMEGDDFVQRIVREAPGYLAEGGYCQIVAQWASVRGKGWEERLSGWFEGSGCDVWIISLATQNVDTYAISWISETEKSGTDDFSRRWENWMAYYDDRRIEEVSTGLINMRRKTGRPNWFWADADAEKLDTLAGEAIERGFRLRDFLSETSDNAALLATALQIVPEALLQHSSRSDGESWKPDKIVLRHTKGIHYAGNLDALAVRLLGQCNGRRPLGELVDDLAQSLGVDRNRITDSTLEIVRRLIERGFLLPPMFCS
jgi:predicted RNA methylase